MSTITIDNEWLYQIKKKHAYPIIDKVVLTDEELKEYIVKQALYEYFVKFPLTSEVEYAINNEMILDFPDTLTFGVLDCRIIGKGFKGASTGSFWDLIIWNKIGFNPSRSLYGSQIRNYNPNELLQTRYSDRQVINTLINQGTFKHRCNMTERKLYVYSSMSAMFNVTWAKYSNDFSKVSFNHIWDVIALAQGYMLLYIADMGDLMEDSAMEIKIDSATLREKGGTLIQTIKDKWTEYPDPVIIRGG